MTFFSFEQSELENKHVKNKLDACISLQRIVLIKESNNPIGYQKSIFNNNLQLNNKYSRN